MLIYDSLLAGKRILFSGDTRTNSVEEVQDYVFACQSLVAPLMHGISNIVNPYIELKTEDQLDDAVYIGGVINPLFKSSKKFQERYDVLICIDKPNGSEKATPTGGGNLHASHSQD